MTLAERAAFIERVFRGSYSMSFLLLEEVTPEIRDACEQVRTRYSALKQKHDFTTAAHLARVEWLVEYLGKNA